MTEKRGRSVFWIVLIMLVLMAALAIAFMTAMPGKSYTGSLPSLSDEQVATSANLKKHVTYLAGSIGERNVIAYQNLESARQYIKDSLDVLGYGVRSQDYTVQMRKVQNLIAEIPGSRRPGEIVIIGAHYDTVYDCPGADDNSSGVAGLLELARLLRKNETARTLRFVAFVNEEPPWFQTEAMGSWVYAKQARRLRENIVAAVSIESIGVYADAEGSQKYPPGFGRLYPSKGNFISFVGNVESRKLVRAAIRSFRQTTRFPSEGAALPRAIPGVGWSDHWSFWEAGYPAIMVTDTAPFRNKNYHLPTDTPETLDYDRMARVVHGLAEVVMELAR
jgi:Zn-dependent M28 family amino/carboxypeptidase